MTKSHIFIVLSILLFLIGGLLLYIILGSDKENITLLSAVGSFLMGIAMLILSQSKAIRGERPKQQ